MNRRRLRATRAFAAGLVMPGLGQLYAGDWVHGALVLLAVASVVPAAARVVAGSRPTTGLFVLTTSVVVASALYLGSALYAARVAAARSEERAPWQRGSLYALFVAVGYLFVLAPFTANVRDQYLETFVVPSPSMQPAILPGDRVLTDKTVGRSGGAKIRHGAIAVFTYPNDRTLTFVKRVIGLPGDRIDIDGESVRVNGEEVTRGPAELPGKPLSGVRAMRERGDRGEYVALWPSESHAPTVSVTVPDAHVFVLGDDRAHATDSRTFGTVPIADVKGIARIVWYSSSRDGGIRWDRIGHVLE